MKASTSTHLRAGRRTPGGIGLPHRVSLIAQTEEVLLRGMRNNHWKHRLPGERSLCQDLQISRWTLRAALANLAARKFIRIKHGRSCEIVVKARDRKPRAHTWRLGYIVAYPLSCTRPFVALMVDEMREYVRQLGGHLEIYHRPKFYQTRYARALADFVDENPHDCWVLSVSTRPMQLWFQRRGLPVIIGGSLHAGVRLPSINLDYFGVGRHAGGALLARGHRRAAVIASTRGVPSLHVGAAELARGFQAAFAASPHPSSEPIVVWHNGERRKTCQVLDRLIELPEPPSALLFTDSQSFLVALTHFGRRQIAVPEKMSLIVAENEPYFSHIVPEATHYEWVLKSFMRQWAVLLQKAMNHTLTADTCIRIVPRFVTGETLGTYGAVKSTKVP